MEQVWPLVGRSGELALLRASLEHRDSRALVLAGAPGVGKSRLAREALSIAKGLGFAVSVAAATGSASHLPFGALAPLLGEPGNIDPSRPSVSQLEATLRHASTELLRAAGPRRLVLFVDDAHLLDPSSATLIHQLAHEGLATVLVTLVPGVPAPDSVVALWKDGLGTRIDLPPLTLKATEVLVRTALSGPVDGAAAMRLAEVSHGNPLYLRELLAGSIANDTLIKDEGLWRLRGRLAPSGRLVELIEARLGALSREEHEALEIIAFAQPLTAPLLARVVDVAVAVDLERTGLLITEDVNGETATRLSHPLYSEVIRAATPGLRVPQVARRLVDALDQGSARSDEDVLRAASWRLSAGETTDADPELLLAAARIARWRYDFPLAERLVAAAGRSDHQTDLLIAELAGLQGQAERADELMRKLAGNESDDALYAEVVLMRTESTAFHLGELDRADRIAGEALPRLAGTENEENVEALRCAIAYASKGPKAVAAQAFPLLEKTSGQAYNWVSMVASQSAANLGDLEHALDLAWRGLRNQESLNSKLRWYPCFHVMQLCDALNGMGRFQEARRIALDHYRSALRERSAETQAALALQLARTVGDYGRLRSAAQYARESAGLYSSLGRPQFELLARQYLALALALKGQGDEATIVLEAIDRLGMARNHIMAADLYQARAWTCVARGDVPGGLRLLREYAEWGADSGDHVGEAAALHAIARLDRPDEVADRLRELAESVDGDLVAARSAHVDALAGADAGRLDEVSRRFDELGAALLAAETAADAARCWHRHGRARLARASQTRAGFLAEQADEPRTPALAGVRSRTRLTASERRIAMLVATGRTNRVVAEELRISVRTVESHLQRVYGKLNITSRSELAAALGPSAQDTD